MESSGHPICPVKQMWAVTGWSMSATERWCAAESSLSSVSCEFAAFTIPGLTCLTCALFAHRQVLVLVSYSLFANLNSWDHLRVWASSMSWRQGLYRDNRNADTAGTEYFHNSCCGRTSGDSHLRAELRCLVAVSDSANACKPVGTSCSKCV